jgi:hypothetical protein
MLVGYNRSRLPEVNCQLEKQAAISNSKGHAIVPWLDS